MSDEKEAAKPAEKEKKQPMGPPMLAVPPALMKQTLDLLQNELSMAKCRDVVLALERCQVVKLPLQGKAEDD